MAGKTVSAARPRRMPPAAQIAAEQGCGTCRVPFRFRSMPVGMVHIGWMLAGMALTSIYFILTHRRRTLELQYTPESLPDIQSGLTVVAGLTRAAVQSRNKAAIIQNGAFFDALEADIRAAQQTVHIESFVWTRGVLERRFVDLLCAKVRDAVEVRVLIDAMGGNKADRGQLRRLRDGGVDLAVYCTPDWWNLRLFNHRTHRKIFVVDGKVGYTCGHGIADQWLGNAEDPDHWRDTAVRLEGPVVHSLQAVFMENWIQESHRVPSGNGSFPRPIETGPVDSHVVSDSVGDTLSSVEMLYTVAIACARHEVIIQNPYFAPDYSVCTLFDTMVRRGVEIHLMVPGEQTDSPFVRRAGCYLYGPLLRAGVRLYEFQPTLLHQKIVIVDGIWSHVGSSNFDSRSLKLNAEVGIGLLDRDIALQLKSAFEDDLRRSRELTLEAWRKRPLYESAIDWVAYQLHDQL
jgi:cardiolipin synthase